MLQTVSIQNFKSLKDVTVRLQKVNLLIGPNNSGKSNFLKALAFIKEHLDGNLQPHLVDFDRLYFQQKPMFFLTDAIRFLFRWDKKVIDEEGEVVYGANFSGFDRNKKLRFIEALLTSDSVLPRTFKIIDFPYALKNTDEYNAVFNTEVYNLKNGLNQVFQDQHENFDDHTILNLKIKDGNATIKEWIDNNGEFLKRESFDSLDYRHPAINIDLIFESIKIYKPEPSKITKESLLLFDKNVNEDCSNLVAFLDNMRDEHPEVWKAIEKDLNKCIPQFEGINFGKVKINGNQESIGKRFGLRDTAGKTYWADELSEGTIYFLALLAIVHQPNPPKILLLEEPEKGIHPRRIAEMMNLIFRLAEDKDIQIVLTSHSTQVVDEFQDMPESVFVFDLIDGETKIKNLLTDIIEPDNEKAEQQNYPKLDFSKNSLGEHWAIGFLGGVPAK